MANLINRSITQTGNSDPVVLDWMAAPFEATVQIWLTANASYALQYTLDNVMTTATTDVRWFEDSRAPAGTAATKVVGYSDESVGPIVALRLVVASLTGPIELKVAQGMRA